MTKRKSFGLAFTLALFALVQGAWAQTDVSSESALLSAISGNTVVSVRLTADITLSQCLLIDGSKTVTIDLNGHELGRGLSATPATGDGHVIGVRAGSSVTINDVSGNNAGRISSGWAANGGGIYNNKGATVTINGGTIVGSHATENGGGIYNAGMLVVNGGVISTDMAEGAGGGIYNAGELHFNGGVVLGSYGNDCGGIYNAASGELYMTGGTISGNTSHAGGGGVVNYGTASITGGNIHNNQATTRGGGVWNGGTLTLGAANIVGNHAKIAGGGVFCSAGTINASGTVIRENDAPNGGGVYCASGSTVNINDGTTINSNTASEDGGGVVNYGTMTVNGGIFTGNTAVDEGGGIWNNGTLTIDAATVTGNTTDNYGAGIYTKSNISMQGTVNVSSNHRSNGWDNNVFLTNGHLIVVTGSLGNSSIGVNHESQSGMVTSGYRAHNRENYHFTNDYASITSLEYVNDEVRLSFNGGVEYVERRWDNANKRVVEILQLKRSGAVELRGSANSDDISLSNWGWYYVEGSDVKYGYIDVESNATVYLILREGAKLTADVIRIGQGSSLTIFGQIAGTGVLESPLMGQNGAMGTLIIHGGTINAVGGVGIGTTNSDATTGSVTIYGGSVYAEGTYYGAGIGGGDRTTGINVNIFGGTVKAYGSSGAAGIGGGRGASGGTTRIYGGTVEAHGGKYGAGIGGGSSGNGGLIEISGGSVVAYGGVDAAGIGSGEEGTYEGGVNGGTINISGGEVVAWGKDYGAGIGAGDDADAGLITITGGHVYAQGGTNSMAICTHDDNAQFTSFTIGDTMMVWWERKFIISERIEAIQNRNWIRIEPCTHEDAVNRDNHDGSHTLASCNYCLKRGVVSEHHYGSGHTCSECGATDATYIVTLAQALSETPNGTYSSENITLLKGQTQYTLPAVSTTPTGYTFAGWYIGSEDLVPGGYYFSGENVALYATGETVAIGGNTNIVAVYKLLETGAVTIAADRSTATINGDYAGTDAVNIPGDITVNSVVFNRAFESGVASTVVLPFSISTDKVEGANFYDITEVKKDINGKWSSVGTHRLGKTEVETIVANKPYLVKLKDGEALTFQGSVTLNTSVRRPYTVNDGLWSFRGAYRTFAIGDSASLVGVTYGFTSTSQDGYDKGVFAKGASDASIPAMRCYLVYMDASAPQGNRQQARAAFMAPTYTSAIPGTIDVEFDDDEEGTTVVGKLNTRTGEIHLAPRTADLWLDIQGRVLNGKPTIKGKFLHNGKLEIIK